MKKIFKKSLRSFFPLYMQYRFLKINTILIIILILTLIISGCSRKDLWDNNNIASPELTLPDVTLTGIEMDAVGIRINWRNPVGLEYELEETQISWTDGPTTNQGETGAETYTITGVTDGVEYNITFIVYDIFDNHSNGVNITVMYLAASTNKGHFIYTPEDLNAVRGSVTGYDDWNLSCDYYLMADIDLSGYSSGEGWLPIGEVSPGYTGSFNGNNHIISNLTINRSTSFIGLFGYNSGTVKNLVINNVSVAGLNDVGALAGYNNGADITNSSASGNVQGNMYVGGLIGYNNSGNITGCHASGTVTGTNDCLGGLIGLSVTASISDSYAEGNVSSTLSTADFIGGLIGQNSIGTVSNCHATGEVSGVASAVGGLIGVNDSSTINNGSYASGNVSGGTETGGLIGYNFTGTITGGCHYTAGTVTGTGSNTGGLVGMNLDSSIEHSWTNCTVNSSNNYTGGLIGRSSNSTVDDCSASGQVNNTASQTGGLIGCCENGSLVINSHADCSVLITGSGAFIGGLVGQNIASTINNSYATGNVTGDTAVGGLVGRNEDLIELCFATGDVVGTTNEVGGLVGANSGSGIIVNCYAKGDISATGFAGGLVGRCIAGSSTTYCYAIGIVSATSDWGGLIGFFSSGILNNCYFNHVNYINGGNLNGYMGIPTYLADMIIEGTYISWDIDPPPASTIWNIQTGTNEGYPYLRLNPPPP